MWESGHMKIGGLAVSRQMGHLRSSSFFSIASLRNSISALGAFILDMGLWGEVILLRIGFMRTISHFTCEPFCCWSHECGDPLERKKLLLGYCGCAHRRYWFYHIWHIYRSWTGEIVFYHIDRCWYERVTFKPTMKWALTLCWLVISCSGFDKLVGFPAL